MNKLLQWLTVTLLSSLALVSHADQYVKYGDYEIHYIAFNSTFIAPDIAKNVGIQRSKRQALVNISVLKVVGDTKKPVAAIIKGEATNLIPQTQEIRFKKVDEGDAIYYLGQFGHVDNQVIRLAITVQPDPNKPPYTLKFEQKFYEE
ncbi:MAG: hypothetical protein CSA61_00600 [Neptuniibacter caesariensis]|uniref:DUF4426 domain-containing protein n=1 Tax=Neptuniibacter caesariensis TaxID=207954 RepID=A0A2G6JBA3_NEPCE|nr:MAG: hypothetical protein CSA61_00600 [Neptuniibacter caesariensis]